MADTPPSGGTVERRILISVEMPTISTTVDEVWPDGDALEDITAQAVEAKLKADGLGEWFYLDDDADVFVQLQQSGRPE